KLDQAQFRELEAFAKFGSDLDAATMSVLEKGKRNVEVLKQGQYSPLSVEKQVAIIFLGSKGLLKDVPVEKVRAFEEDLLSQLEAKHPEVLKSFAAGKLEDEMIDKLRALASDVQLNYK
ncbi:MAG: F0F1 ATP synthase subunit alpha, partial [Chitinophagales bacterium]